MKDTRDLDAEAREFWQGFIKEEGETVVAKAMGALQLGPREDERLWGILVLTQKRFVFREMPTDRTLLGFKLPSQERKPKEPVVIDLGLGEIKGLVEGPSGFWARLVGPPFPPFRLSWTEADGQGREETFTHDPTTGFVKALRAALG